MTRTRYPELADADWLRARYEMAGETQEEIANRIGCSRRSISAALARHGIDGRPSGRPPAVVLGGVFGKLTAIAEAEPQQRKAGGSHRMYLCRCECGTEKVVRGSRLTDGTTRSCGCSWIASRAKMQEAARCCEGHAAARTPTYSSYKSMMARCFNPRATGWKYYGGRGITVCDRWLGRGAFLVFLADMGERPESKTLDRIDPDGNYEPGNCRWATWPEQRANQRA
jgi:hypothetical protein